MSAYKTGFQTKLSRVNTFNSLFFKPLILAACIGLCFFVFDFYLGLKYPHTKGFDTIFQESKDPEILFELRPEAKLLFLGQKVSIPATSIKISSKGLRDYEYTLDKPNGIYRIIVLGDSVAFGWGVELEDTFAKQLERRLKRIGKYEVINFSVPGYNAAQEIATLERKCLAYNPDLVIFSVIDNDRYPKFNYFLPLYNYLPRSLRQSYLTNWFLGQMVILTQRLRPMQIKKGMQEADFAFNKLNKIIRAHRNLKVLFYSRLRWLESILGKYGLEGLMINSDKSEFTNRLYIIPGDGHPNAAGHRKMAEDIYHYLQLEGYLKNANAGSNY
jgi:hypothetical protein